MVEIDLPSRASPPGVGEQGGYRPRPATAPGPEIPDGLRGRLREAAQARNTRIAYDSAWSAWSAHCDREGIEDPLDATPEEVCTWFERLGCEPSPGSGKLLAVSTMGQYRCALSRRYSTVGRPLPGDAGVREILAAVERVRGTPPRQVRALREHQVLAMIEAALATSPAEATRGLRDAAMLALGFSAALRRSELAALLVSDLRRHSPGADGTERILLRIRRSKTDQAGRGHHIPVIDGSAVRAVSRVRGWLAAAGHDSDPDAPLYQGMYRGGRLTGHPITGDDVARVVKRYAREIGLEPRHYAGHSLRAGFVTSAAAHGSRIDRIMAITRHKSTEMVASYIRVVDVFEDHAGAAFL